MYEYLKDNIFLKKLDELRVKDIYAKIIALDWNENPIKEIQGKVQNGSSCSFDGAATTRRTCNIQLFAETSNNNITNILDLESFENKYLESIFSINKKVKLEIGYKNPYSDYKGRYGEIIWFPLGIYIIITPSLSHSASGVSISLELRDKMSLLNGTCGGTLPASITFSEIEDYDEEGEPVISHPTIFQIIQELVHHWGGIPISQIYINDVDLIIKSTQRYTNSDSCYKVKYIDEKDEYICKIFMTEKEADNFISECVFECQKIECKQHEDIGYIYTDFTYPGELVGNAGQTVEQILTTIRDRLGNYEFFFDINGNFIFQEIKNYLNTSYSSTELLKNSKNSDYKVDFSSGKSVYSFENVPFIVSYNNNPNMSSIRNDFIVWGIRKGVNNENYPIRYHLAIDNKPQIGNTYNCVIVNKDDIYTPISVTPVDTLPKFGTVGTYYQLQDGKTYTWIFNESDEYDKLNNELDIQQNVYNSTEKELNKTKKELNEVIEFIDYYKEYIKTYSSKLTFLQETIIELQEQRKNIQSIEEKEAITLTITQYKNKIQELESERVKLKAKSQKYTEKRQEELEITIEKLTQSLKILENKILDLKNKILNIRKDLYYYEEIPSYLIKTIDWREELYMQGSKATVLGTYGNEYYVELKNEWPKLVDYNPDKLVKNIDNSVSLAYSEKYGYYKPEVIETPTTVEYFLDFIDTNASINMYNVSSIGKRSHIVGDNQSGANCVFEPDIDDIIFINENDEDYLEQIENCKIIGQKYAIVNDKFLNNIMTGGTYNSAYSKVKDLLYQFTNMCESITISSLPIYYLEPNTRIFVRDNASGINGDYIIKTISLPLDNTGTMNITATRALERI